MAERSEARSTTTGKPVKSEIRYIVPTDNFIITIPQEGLEQYPYGERKAVQVYQPIFLKFHQPKISPVIIR
jgi:hypothetical protein